MTAAPSCPTCGSPMVERRNRATGAAFWGCPRYPACRGTRVGAPADPSGGPRRAPSASRRIGLSAGGRARGLPDYVELLVARRVGRTLTPAQGCLVQVVAVMIVGLLLWAAFASGLVAGVVHAFGQWYASQLHFGPTPKP